MASVVIKRPATDAASCDPHNLRRIDNAGADHIDELLGLGVIAERLGLVFKDLMPGGGMGGMGGMDY
jgi:hypothetical protein